MRPRELRSEYYHDRWSEDDLCHDFPGDEILIDGLHAMQRHFYHNGVYLEIPVVNVMNTAHFLAAYMFATTCSGDQLEYDALADMSLGRGKQMFRVTMIVLAAMLARTEGFRARQCRDLILENRDPDFEEGVTLYDRFLRSAEKRFAEVDFLIDTHTRIQQLTTQNEQLITENTQLKYQYRLMEEKYQQINIGTQNNYTGCTINNYYGQPSSTAQPENVTPEEEPAKAIDSIIFTKKAKVEHKESYIIAALQKSVQGRKDKTRAFVQELHDWQNQAYVDAHFNARVMYDELEKLMPISFGYDGFKRLYNNSRN